MESMTNGATDERTREFLSVEEMARELAIKLSKLDEAASEHALAASDLSESAKATRKLVDVVRDLGQKAVEALDIVASVGGPSIIEQLKALESSSKSRFDQLRGRIHWAIGIAGTAAVLALASAIVAVLK